MRSILIFFITCVLTVSAHAQYDSAIVLLNSCLSTEQYVNDDAKNFLKTHITPNSPCGNYVKLLVLFALDYSKGGDFDRAKNQVVIAKNSLSNCSEATYLWPLLYYADAYNYEFIGATEKADSLANLGLKTILPRTESNSIIRLYLIKSSASNKLSDQLYHLEKALELCNQEENNIFKRKVLLSMGYCYAKNENYTEAKRCFLEALPLVEKQNSGIDKSIIYNNLAYFSTDSTEVLGYLDSAIYYSTLRDDIEGVQLAKENKSYFLFSIGKFKRAYSLLEESIFLKDSIYNIKKIEAVSEIEAKYKNEKRNSEIQRLKLDKLNRELKLLEYQQQAAKLNDSLKNFITEQKLERLAIKNKHLADSIAQAENERLENLKNERVKTVAERRNRIQYSAVIILVLILASIIASSGKMKINPRIAEGLIFIFFILLFEFALVVTDPWVDQLSKGQVGYKIAINTIIALILFAAHQKFEKGLKKLIVDRKRS